MRLRITGLLLLVGLIFAFTLVSLSRVNAKAAGTMASLVPAVVPMRAGLEPAGQQSGPTLQLSTAVTATPGSVITVPLAYAGQGFGVTSLAFSLDIDQTCLAFAPSDLNSNGLPDAITVHVPPGVNTSVAVDLLDEDGELDVIIADFFPPFVTLPDRTALLEIRLRAVCPVEPGTDRRAAVRFSTAPSPSLGTANGAPITGHTIDGFVTISGPPLPPTATPTPSLTATPTPPLIPTQPMATPTFVPTAPPDTIIAYFTALPQYPHIRLQWQTAQEVDTTGFYIYRRHLERGADFLLISHLLPAQGAQGVYTFIDQAVQNDDHYLYLLVEEKANGARTEFIALMTTGSLADHQPHQLLLPLIVR